VDTPGGGSSRIFPGGVQQPVKAMRLAVAGGQVVHDDVCFHAPPRSHSRWRSKRASAGYAAALPTVYTQSRFCSKCAISP
jgi:hypothetical protein